MRRADGTMHAILKMPMVSRSWRVTVTDSSMMRRMMVVIGRHRSCGGYLDRTMLSGLALSKQRNVWRTMTKASARRRSLAVGRLDIGTNTTDRSQRWATRAYPCATSVQRRQTRIVIAAPRGPHPLGGATPRLAFSLGLGVSGKSGLLARRGPLDLLKSVF